MNEVILAVTMFTGVILALVVLNQRCSERGAIFLLPSLAGWHRGQPSLAGWAGGLPF